MSNFDLVLYHGNCPDGFCSAFVASRAFPNAEFKPLIYGQEIPQVKGRNVLVVDFSWDRETVEELHADAASLVILDHHKTAEAALKGLDYAHFDMTRSGAQLAWDYLFPDEPRPWYVDYVADRDLWAWKLPDSKAVSAFIMSTPYNFEAWHVQIAQASLETAIREGKGILRQVDHYVEKVVAEARDGFLGSDRTIPVKIVNAAYPNCSDVGNELCKRGATISIIWFERGDGLIQFSLRSIGDTDVSSLAATYRGGGHKNAAGFQLPVAEARRLIDAILGR